MGMLSGYGYAVWLFACCMVMGMLCGYGYAVWLFVCCLVMGMLSSYGYAVWLWVCCLVMSMLSGYGMLSGYCWKTQVSSLTRQRLNTNRIPLLTRRAAEVGKL